MQLHTTEAQGRLTGGEAKSERWQSHLWNKAWLARSCTRSSCNPGNRNRESDGGERFREVGWGMRLDLRCHCYCFSRMIISARWVETNRQTNNDCLVKACMCTTTTLLHRQNKQVSAFFLCFEVDYVVLNNVLWIRANRWTNRSHTGTECGPSPPFVLAGQTSKYVSKMWLHFSTSSELIVPLNGICACGWRQKLIRPYRQTMHDEHHTTLLHKYGSTFFWGKINSSVKVPIKQLMWTSTTLKKYNYTLWLHFPLWLLFEG